MAQGLFFVRVKMFFTFTKDEKLAQNTGMGVVPDWTEQEQKKFIEDFKKSVSDHWDGKYHFACSKPGWTNLLVRPRFAPVFTEKKTLANYAIDIIKNTSPYGPKGDKLPADQRLLWCNALVTANPVEPGIFGPSVPQRHGYFQSFQAETVSLGVTAANIGQDELARIKGLIAQHKVNHLTFPKNSAVSARGRSEGRQGLLRRPEDSAGAIDTPAGADDPCRGRTGRREPRRYRCRAGQGPGRPPEDQRSDNPTKPDIAFPVDATKSASGLACNDDSFVKDASKWVNRKYNIAAHEFGHMLGLPDEYQNSTVAGAKDEERRERPWCKRPSSSSVTRPRSRRPPSGRRRRA